MGRLPARPSSRPSSSTTATPSPTGSTKVATIVSAENDHKRCGTETSSSSYKEDLSDFCGLKSLIRHHHAGFRRGRENTSCNSLKTVRQNIDDAVPKVKNFSELHSRLIR